MFLIVIKVYHFFFHLNGQYQSLLYIYLHHTVMRGERLSHENSFDISFTVTSILSLSRKTELCLVLVTNAKYIVCLSFPDPQPQFN